MACVVMAIIEHNSTLFIYVKHKNKQTFRRTNTAFNVWKGVGWSVNLCYPPQPFTIYNYLNQKSNKSLHQCFSRKNQYY